MGEIIYYSLREKFKVSNNLATKSRYHLLTLQLSPFPDAAVLQGYS
jgi:hypothetical protein